MAVGIASLNKPKQTQTKGTPPQISALDIIWGKFTAPSVNGMFPKCLLKCVSFVLSPSLSVTSLCDAAPLLGGRSPYQMRLALPASLRVSICLCRLDLCLLGSGHQNIFIQLNRNSSSAVCNTRKRLELAERSKNETSERFMSLSLFVSSPCFLVDLLVLHFVSYHLNGTGSR